MHDSYLILHRAIATVGYGIIPIAVFGKCNITFKIFAILLF